MSTALHELASREGHKILGERDGYGLGRALRVLTRGGHERVLKLIADPGDADGRARWTALGSLASPAGVVRVAAVGRCDAGLWCLIDDNPHPTVEHWALDAARRGPLDVALVRGVADAVATVVARLHRQRPTRVHGALDPASVLIAPDRNRHHDIALLDVGVVDVLRLRWTPPGASDPRAPHVARGEAPEVADDVYGVAALVAFLLSAHDPSAAPSHWRELSALGGGPRRDAIARLRAGFAPALIDVLSRALDAERGLRPRSVDELKRLLTAIPDWEREAPAAPRREALRDEPPGEPPAARRSLPSAMRFGRGPDDTVFDPRPPEMPGEDDARDRTLPSEPEADAGLVDATLPTTAPASAFAPSLTPPRSPPSLAAAPPPMTAPTQPAAPWSLPPAPSLPPLPAATAVGSAPRPARTPVTPWIIAGLLAAALVAAALLLR